MAVQARPTWDPTGTLSVSVDRHRRTVLLCLDGQRTEFVLRTERPEHRFIQALERAEPDDVVGVLRLKQMLHHVKDEEGTHAVIGKALPHLGREQETQRPRMPEEIIRSRGAPIILIDSWKGHRVSTALDEPCNFQKS